VADFLVEGYPNAALGAEMIHLFRIQEVAVTLLTIALADFVLSLTGRALRHDGPPHHHEISAA